MKLYFTKKNILFFILVIVTLTLYFFSGGNHNIPLFVFLWPGLFVIIIKYTKPKWLLAIFGILGLVVYNFKFYRIAEDTTYLSILLCTALFIIQILPFIANYFLEKYIKGYKKVFLLPLLVATFDVISSLTVVANNFDIASCVGHCTSLIQIASIFGCFGVTFLIVWVSTSLAYFSEKYLILKERDVNLIKIGICPLVLFSSLIFGTIRIQAKKQSNQFNVASVSLVEDLSDENYSKIEKYVKKASDSNMDLVVFSEEAIEIKYHQQTSLEDAFKQMANKYNIYILAGVDVESEDLSTHLHGNKTYLFNTNNEIVFEYYKTNLIPIEESEYQKGDGKIPNVDITFPSGNSVKLSSVICFDSDYLRYVRDRVDNDTGTLIVPTFDWYAIKEYHLNHVLYRAIENGLSVVRSTYQGYTTNINAYGEIVQSTDYYQVGSGYMSFMNVDTEPVFTLYKYIGIVTDFLFPLSLALLLGHCITVHYKDKKRSLELNKQD